MQKRYFFIIVSLTIISFFLFNYNRLFQKHETIDIIKDEKESKEKIQPTGYNSLAIMLQNENGGYDLSNSDTWPTDGYVFNPDLSRCENGGILSWNDATKSVTLKTSGSDKCYVYFDIYVPKYTEFDAVTVDSDFSTYCQIDISYDKGGSWEKVNIPTEYGKTISLQENAIIKLSLTSSGDSIAADCGVKVCDSESDCRISHDKYNCPSLTLGIYGNNKQYTIVGNKHYYALTFCFCLTGDNDIWVIEDNKKKKKKIKDLKKGDKVLILDDAGQIKTIKVKDIKINKVNTIYKITLNNGEIIKSSMRHLFIAENFGEIMAEELKVGSKLLDVNGNYQEIKDIEIENYPEGIEVYSIITDQDNKISKLAITAMIVSVSYGINISDVKASGMACPA